MMVECKCDECGKDITINGYKFKTYKTHFCGNECKDNYKRKNTPKGENSPIYSRITVKCSYCGKDKHVSKYNAQKILDHYCNRECMINHRNDTGHYKGENNFNYKGENKSFNCTYCGVLSEKKSSTNLKYSVNHFCSIECQAKWKSENLTGDNAYNWRGGNGTLLTNIRRLTASSDWIKAVFLRDEFKCQACGNGSNKLNAHHLSPFRDIIRRYNITSSREAQACNELWDIDNGVAMCRSCHIQFHRTYGIYEFTPEDFLEFKELEEAILCH